MRWTMRRPPRPAMFPSKRCPRQSLRQLPTIPQRVSAPLPNLHPRYPSPKPRDRPKAATHRVRISRLCGRTGPRNNKKAHAARRISRPGGAAARKVSVRLSLRATSHSVHRSPSRINAGPFNHPRKPRRQRRRPENPRPRHWRRHHYRKQRQHPRLAAHSYLRRRRHHLHRFRLTNLRSTARMRRRLRRRDI